MQTDLLWDLAACLEYPTAGLTERARRAARELSRIVPEMATALETLSAFVETDVSGAEERYTRLFDLDPMCTLHLGYHLFGEDYQRGSLLYLLRIELRKAGIDEKGDLPDFLPSLLRLLSRLGAEDGRLLVDSLMAPALVRMNRELEKSDDAYACVLRALPALLAAWCQTSADIAVAGEGALSADV